MNMRIISRLRRFHQGRINPETHVTPRLLEVYFSNLCNMSCTYCSAKFSSVIQHENEKFGEFTKD